MLTQELRKAGYGDVQVRSGGMNALIGHPADGRAQCVMRPRGIDPCPSAGYRTHALGGLGPGDGARPQEADPFSAPDGPWQGLSPRRMAQHR